MKDLITKLNRYLPHAFAFRRLFLVGALLGSVTALGGCQLVVVDANKMITTDMIAATMAPVELAPTPTPLPGSADISFMDPTTAALDGCRMLTRVTIRHRGDFNDGMIRLRNTAARINANMIVPVRIIEAHAPENGHLYHAKMMRCPKTSDA